MSHTCGCVELQVLTLLFLFFLSERRHHLTLAQIRERLIYLREVKIIVHHQAHEGLLRYQIEAAARLVID